MRKNNTTVTFKLPLELKEQLEKLAKDDGRTLSNLIVRICTVYAQGKT